MYNLSPELIAEILLWLPVKDLIRLKCVSKLFKGIIESRHFTKTHFFLSIHKNTRLNLITFNKVPDAPSIYAVNFDNGLRQVLELNCPLKSLYGTFILGSCHGLLLLFTNRVLRTSMAEEMRLWNPFTRRYKLLPHCPFYSSSRFSDNFVYAGLGYDSASDDYKVVRIEDCEDYNVSYQVWVYGLRSNSWRRVQDFPFCGYEFGGQESGSFIDGVLYWMVYNGDDVERIIGFDLATESFSEIADGIPKPIDNHSEVSLYVIGGCLCLNIASKYVMPCTAASFECYIWQKYDGGIFSWTQLYNVKLGDFSVSKDMPYDIQPLAYSKEGGKVLLNVGGMGIVWYDLKLRKAEMILVRGLSYYLDTVVCCESLNSLGNDSEFDGLMQRNQTSMTEKRKYS